MLRSGRIVGVEIAGARARIALVAPRPVPTVVACQEIVVEPGSERNLPALVARAITQLGARRADVHLAFSPPTAGAARHLLFNAPKLSRSELQQVALRELRKDPLAHPDESYTAVEALDSVEIEGGTKAQRYLLAALNKEIVDNFAVALLDARLVIRSATTGPLALVRTASLFEQPGRLIALVGVDSARSTLLVIENGIPRFFRDIAGSPKGGRDDSDTLAAQALARELDISLVYFAQQNRPKQVAAVFVSGVPELVDQVSEYLDDRGTYDLPTLAPGPGLHVVAEMTAPLATYAVAIGAALGSRTKSAPDLLPSELRGRPERLIALVAASVLVLAATFGIVQLRAGALAEQDREEQRHRSASETFDRVKREVEVESRLEEAAVQAGKWRTFFGGVDDHHRQLGQLVVGVAGAVPASARLTRFQFDRSATPAVRPVPVAGAAVDETTHVVHLEGHVRAPGLPVAQDELRRLVRALELLPGVKLVELAPIKNPGLAGDEVEIAFSLEVRVKAPFPMVAP